MDEESCSWVTRAKFIPTAYLRSGSSGLPSITYGYKSDRPLDLEEKRFILESKSKDFGSGSAKVAFQSGNITLDSKAKEKEACLDSQLASFTVKTDWKLGRKFKVSNKISSDSLSFEESFQHGGNQSTLHVPKDSDSQTVDLSLYPAVITTPNPVKESILFSSDTFSCKYSMQEGRSQSLSHIMLTDSASQSIDFSFNPGSSTTLPQRNSNLFSSDLSCKSYLHHHQKKSLNPMKVSDFQSAEFSFHFNVSTNSNAKDLDFSWLSFSKKKVDPRLHNSCLFSDQKELKSKPKHRSVSPLPQSILSDVFKEAKCISKRFSTPPPHREPKKNVSRNSCPFNEWKPFQDISHGKGLTKLREKKENGRTRYFDSGVRVTALETTDKWMVNLSELYIGARFAFGAHSRLYYGRYKDQPVAVKIIKLPDDDENGVMSARLEKQFTREMTSLTHLYHRNVIKLAGACKKSPIFFVITEYLSGGSLRAFLHKLDHNPLPLDKLMSIALDVSRGMEYIHSQGVIHRDLKPENILFDHNFCVKIADFGVACEEAYCDILEDDAGTYRWMAPEMIKHKPYGRKVDVYSFGLLLWEMITGSIPYEDMSPVQAAFAVVDKNMRPVIPADSPFVLRVLIEQCWSTIPEKRPEFWQIVKVLEQFESDLARGEAPKHLQNLPFQDHKKRLLNWVEKLRPPKVSSFRPTPPKRQ